ncbi:hypothetical protein IT418_00820 [bacterium]|nr:hypothetical protein [bacterium]
MTLLPDVPAVILNLPIILTLIAVTRYIIGFKTWKTYPVVALTLAYYFFYQLLESTPVALCLWVLFVLITVGSAIFVRQILRRFKINYYARIAAMYLGSVTIALLFMALLSKTSLSTLLSDQFFGIAVFLIGSTIDDLATLFFKKDSQEFTRRSITTVVLSLFSGLLLTWPWWNTFITGHQEILVVILCIDTVAAFWSTIRLTELLRFGSIFNQR